LSEQQPAGGRRALWRGDCLPLLTQDCFRSSPVEGIVGMTCRSIRLPQRPQMSFRCQPVRVWRGCPHVAQPLHGSGYVAMVAMHGILCWIQQAIASRVFVLLRTGKILLQLVQPEERLARCRIRVVEAMHRGPYYFRLLVVILLIPCHFKRRSCRCQTV